MPSFSINGVLQAEYKYAFAGRQAIRKLYGANPVTVHSAFDSEGRRIAEYNEATGALIREYVWLGWEPIAVIEGGVVYYIRADHIGRPVFATNASGAKVWSVTYTPFGGVHVATGLPVEARFPGQWYQSESGLHQNWMRDYDPTTGRYIQGDPLGLVDGASVYGYALQRPTRYVDVLGLYTVRCIATSAGGVDYEKSSEYSEGDRKICEYQCTRLDTGVSKTIRGCGRDLIGGDVCYGAEFDNQYMGNNNWSNNTTSLNEFDFDTESQFYNYFAYESDFIDVILENFGEQ